MPRVIKILTNYVIGPIITFGVYVFVFGHLLPGEGFDGGMIVASIFILCIIVYGKEEMEKRISIGNAVFISVFSGILIIIMGFVGMLGLRFEHKYYLDNFLSQGTFSHLFSGGTVPIFNILVGLSITFGFYAIFAYLSEYKTVDKINNGLDYTDFKK
ncbi:MAG: hypothetical protein A2551_05050 [Elusimicrobia bacterium RIFOXYD2_FULL_34_30]|nr:MAG: hypothetical protein A2551_05050 [Elusimicrobia bacterium RIFOXYD2_FULL_34_30]